jgi:hydrogenase maturation factor
MTTKSPVTFTWNGASMAMVPQQRQHWLCNKQFADGQVYDLIEHEERSTSSHNHFFAAVHEAWKNLPEVHAKRFKTSEHLRKWALIHTGYANETMMTLETPAEAMRVAAIFANDPGFEFAVLAVSESVVRIYTAKTQKATGKDSMGKEDFQKSKQEVLETVAEMIGVTVEALLAQVADRQRPNDSAGREAEKPAGGPPKWVATYRRLLEEHTDPAPKSLKRKHDEAIVEIGGTPAEADLALMRKIYGARQRNLDGALTAEQYQAVLVEIGAVAA